jgi:hypothetical protein
VSQPDPTPSVRLLIAHVLAVPELGWRSPRSAEPAVPSAEPPPGGPPGEGIPGATDL